MTGMKLTLMRSNAWVGRSRKEEASLCQFMRMVHNCPESQAVCCDGEKTQKVWRRWMPKRYIRNCEDEIASLRDQVHLSLLDFSPTSSYCAEKYNIHASMKGQVPLSFCIEILRTLQHSKGCTHLPYQGKQRLCGRWQGVCMPEAVATQCWISSKCKNPSNSKS